MLTMARVKYDVAESTSKLTNTATIAKRFKETNILCNRKNQAHDNKTFVNKLDGAKVT